MADERGSIEEIIRSTEALVAEKDAEIAELRRQLEQAHVVPSAAAAAEVLDRDEIVREERQRLAALEAEWREKFGKAEIDISIERAKVAREHAELDERMRQFNDRDHQMRGRDAAAEPSKAALE